MAEAKVTVIDAALAAGILVGLVLNALLGWSWADVAAGVILVAYGLREGAEHLRSSLLSLSRERLFFEGSQCT